MLIHTTLEAVGHVKLLGWYEKYEVINFKNYFLLITVAYNNFYLARNCSRAPILLQTQFWETFN